MTEKPILFSTPMVRAILASEKTQTRRVIFKDDSSHHMPWLTPSGWQDGDLPLRCPYQVGDLLWVREAWQHESPHCADYKCGNPDHVWYRANESATVIDSMTWRPSIFMPRWASRITLRVASVRVQRIQDISEDDAAAEGIKRHSGPYIWDFARLWDEINTKRGYSWNSNPWVWVYKFEKVTP